MAVRLRTFLLIAGVALAAPAAANASAPVPITKLLFVQAGSAMAEVASPNSVPLHFHVSARQAVVTAERSKTMRALHRRVHPLGVFPYVWRSTHPFWYVIFTHGKRIVASAAVSPEGNLTGVWTGPQATAPFSHGGISWSVTNWTVLLPASLLFMLPFLDPRRWRRIVHLDALAVLTFLVSWVLLAQARLYPAVWLAYPPLIYLLVRMVMLGFARGKFGRDTAGGRLAPLLSMRTLLIGLPLILVARIGLSLVGHVEIDVGTESVIGAFRILHHVPIYYNDPNHGDTYGPIAYLAYVPFELVFPWKNSLSNLHAADAAAIFFDLGTVLGLLLLGRRLRPGAEGKRLGLILAWAWAACPFTVIGLVVHTNDALVSMLIVLALLVITSPMASGAVLGLATAAKFSPAALVPLLAAHRQRGVRGAVIFVASFAVVTALAIYSWLPPGGFGYFWQRTLGFQLHRGDVFSPWGLYPGLHPIQTVLEVLVVLFAAAVAFIPRERSLPSLCAAAAAVTIAIQLPATHWYYYYIMWFLPFALVAFVARPARAPEPAAEEAGREWLIQPSEHEPAMAGA